MSDPQETTALFFLEGMKKGAEIARISTNPSSYNWRYIWADDDEDGEDETNKRFKTAEDLIDYVCNYELRNLEEEATEARARLAVLELRICELKKTEYTK